MEIRQKQNKNKKDKNIVIASRITAVLSCKLVSAYITDIRVCFNIIPNSSSKLQQCSSWNPCQIISCVPLLWLLQNLFHPLSHSWMYCHCAGSFFSCMHACLSPLTSTMAVGSSTDKSGWERDEKCHDMLTRLLVGNCHFFAGNPPGHAKKALKQRFLKLLSCCRQPKSIPSISESKWHFVPFCVSSLCWEIITHRSRRNGRWVSLCRIYVKLDGPFLSKQNFTWKV